MNKHQKYLCECKGVSKREILHAIRKNGACTLVDIQNLTQASAGCGRCSPLVNELLDEEMALLNRKGHQLKLDF